MKREYKQLKAPFSCQNLVEFISQPQTKIQTLIGKKSMQFSFTWLLFWATLCTCKSPNISWYPVRSLAISLSSSDVQKGKRLEIRPGDPNNWGHQKSEALKHAWNCSDRQQCICQVLPSLQKCRQKKWSGKRYHSNYIWRTNNWSQKPDKGNQVPVLQLHVNIIRKKIHFFVKLTHLKDKLVWKKNIKRTKWYLYSTK